MTTEISLRGFCALGGLENPRLFTKTKRVCGRVITTYWMRG